MITLDGTHGEGGGQILRSALALSLRTQQAFTVTNIRGNRRKPGLMRQHLTGVLAAAELCGASVAGAELGSTKVVFAPRAITSENLTLRIGTAGSTVLVLQALLPALALTGTARTVHVHGGTHNPMAPTVDYLQSTLVPQLRAMGWCIDISLLRYGFVPAGGGHVRCVILPPATLVPLRLLERGAFLSASARLPIANLAGDIAVRERDVLDREFAKLGVEASTQIAQVEADGPGNAVLVEFAYQHVTEISSGIADNGVRAEQVAKRAFGAAKGYFHSAGPASEWLCDQLLVPMALSAGGEFISTHWSPHAESQKYVIAAFLGDKVRAEKVSAGFHVRVDA